MRTPYRVLTTALAVAAAFPIGNPVAHADATPALFLDSNWFWHDQFDGQIGPTGVGQRMPGAASGTPDGQVGIGYTNGKSATGPLTPEAPAYPEDTPNKEAYLRWKMFGELTGTPAVNEPTMTIPLGSTVNAFSFTLVLDPQRSTPQPQTPIKLVACAVLNDWAPGGPPYGDPYSGKPADDCAVSAEGTWDAAKSAYTFDAKAIAQTWMTTGLNLGVAIRQKPGDKAVFQFNADPAKVTATIDYTAPVPEPSTPPVPPVTGPVYVPPAGPPVIGPAPAPQPVPAPQPQTPPVVAQPSNPQTVPQAATVPFSPDLGLNWTWWAAILFGVLLLGVTSLLLGNPAAVPVAASGRSTPLGRALRAEPDGAAPFRPKHA